MAGVYLAPWFIAFVLSMALLLTVYLYVLPFCIAWLISTFAALIQRIARQD